MIIDIVYGFLGAGKTTFIRRILENPPEGEKLAVLVNEFGPAKIAIFIQTLLITPGEMLNLKMC